MKETGFTTRKAVKTETSVNVIFEKKKQGKQVLKLHC